MATKKATPRLVDERLVAALNHTTRAHALSVCSQRPASTSELAEELGETTSAVWYHVDKLLKLGCIEEVEARKVRGATEHFYRATVRHFFDADAWRGISSGDRLRITMGVLRLISSDLTKAVTGETIAAEDRHLSRTFLNVDGEGWSEIVLLLEETLEGLLRIRERASERMAESGERPIQASVSVLHFELPGRSAGRGAS